MSYSTTVRMWDCPRLAAWYCHNCRSNIAEFHIFPPADSFPLAQSTWLHGKVIPFFSPSLLCLFHAFSLPFSKTIFHFYITFFSFHWLALFSLLLLLPLLVLHLLLFMPHFQCACWSFPVHERTKAHTQKRLNIKWKALWLREAHSSCTRSIWSLVVRKVSRLLACRGETYLTTTSQRRKLWRQ